MIEKVNPSHPDKIADRIAGALVDYAYTLSPEPKVAFEVLIGHGKAFIVAETNVRIPLNIVIEIVIRIAGQIVVEYQEVPQNVDLSQNQAKEARAGDNGIFKGVPVSHEVKELSDIAHKMYDRFPTDGKYILAGNRLIICQSNAKESDVADMVNNYELAINPLGPWNGGTDVDTGAANRKLGSDMGEAVTGGGLHGKDLSKADVAVNIFAHLMAQTKGEVVEMHCAIGDNKIGEWEYKDIVGVARSYIKDIGGFEKLAEWGIV